MLVLELLDVILALMRGGQGSSSIDPPLQTALEAKALGFGAVDVIVAPSFHQEIKSIGHRKTQNDVVRELCKQLASQYVDNDDCYTAVTMGLVTMRQT
jgi:hypothetical protein